MLRLVAAVDLTGEEGLAYDTDYRDRGKLWGLADLPDGARVIVNIGLRQYVTHSAERLIREHMDRLVIQLEGDFEALTSWHRAIVGEVDE